MESSEPVALESNKVEDFQSPDSEIHDDSGHESPMSTPDLLSTPGEERSITPGKKRKIL